MKHGRRVIGGYPECPAFLVNTQRLDTENDKKSGKVLLYLPGMPDSLVYEIYTGKEGSKTERRECVKPGGCVR